MNEYIPQDVAERIKQLAKEKNIVLKVMLEECGSSVNGLAQGSSKKGIGSFTIARIADYLDCSVDYLLGRTDTPDSGNSEILNNLTAEQMQDVIEYVQFLKWRGKAS